MRILITGVGGNVGRYIANGLAHSEHEIIGIYRNKIPENVNYKLVRADISDSESLLQLQNIDTVIHIASALSGSTKKLIRDNIKVTENLVCYAERLNIKRFIYISTVSVYGNVEGELDENCDIINPECYGMTKYLSECLVKESYVPEKLIIQLPRMLGPFVDMENTQGSGFLTMANKIIHGEDVVCYIPDVKYNNYLHVSELEKFIRQIMIKAEWHDITTLLLGAKERLTMLEILQIMKAEIGSKSQINVGRSNTLPKCSIINVDAATKAGFYPCSADDMLKRFIREVYQNANC